jgi:hypothetical protein
MKRVEEGAKAKPKAKHASRASGARKPAAKAKKTANAGRKAKSPPKAGAKAKPGASEAKPIKVRKGEKVAVVLLSGGNPQIAKADGDAPVQAYIAAMPGWKRDLGKRLDTLIVRNVPNVRKAVKWNSPLYGKVTFFRGMLLRPVPPGASKHKDVRYFDIHEGDELDEAQRPSGGASHRPGHRERPPQRVHRNPATLVTPAVRCPAPNLSHDHQPTKGEKAWMVSVAGIRLDSRGRAGMRTAETQLPAWPCRTRTQKCRHKLSR